MFCPECGQIVGPEPLDTRFLNETPDRGLVASLFGRCFAKMRTSRSGVIEIADRYATYRWSLSHARIWRPLLP